MVCISIGTKLSSIFVPYYKICFLLYSIFKRLSLAIY